MDENRNQLKKKKDERVAALFSEGEKEHKTCYIKRRRDKTHIEIRPQKKKSPNSGD